MLQNLVNSSNEVQESRQIESGSSLPTHDAIIAYFDDAPKTRKMHVLADFVLKMDSWFNTPNSSMEESNKNLKCAFGVNLEAQKKALIDCMAVVKDLRGVEM